VQNLLLGEDADIERIAIGAGHVLASARAATLGDALPAEGARHQAIERGAHAGEMLRPIDGKMAARLIKLVLHSIGGDDLDITGDNVRRFIAGGDAVPRVCAENVSLQFHVLKVTRAF
jgi:hypothetical protein